jgi:ASC-1-like (ASCH) protein
MRLQESAFTGIKEGLQTLEVRLNDKKRQLFELGDVIEFSSILNEKEKVNVKIVGLLKYKTFEQLFLNVDLAYWNAKGWSINEAVDSCREYYSKEDELKYGVLGICIKNYNLFF